MAENNIYILYIYMYIYTYIYMSVLMIKRRRCVELEVPGLYDSGDWQVRSPDARQS